MPLKEVEQLLLDDTQRIELARIAKKLKLSVRQVVNAAIAEFIAKHPEPAQPKPPQESEKDKSYRQRIAELSRDMRIARGAILRDIMKLSTLEITRKYAIHQTDIRGFQDYIRRTKTAQK